MHLHGTDSVLDILEGKVPSSRARAGGQKGERVCQQRRKHTCLVTSPGPREDPLPGCQVSLPQGPASGLVTPLTWPHLPAPWQRAPQDCTAHGPPTAHSPWAPATPSRRCALDSPAVQTRSLSGLRSRASLPAWGRVSCGPSLVLLSDLLIVELQVFFTYSRHEPLSVYKHVLLLCGWAGFLLLKELFSM